ncbi:MAG: glycine cleavage system protein GcvH [Chloroflexi bacterium]|nr:glycine cleavage system protein GcvH [Chloroflexota bacterium]
MDPTDRKYSEEHEWALVQGDLVTIGITDFAQDQLGDVVYVELPSVGHRVEQLKVFGVIESVKTASDLYAPVSGEIVEVNQALVDEPAGVNDSPYDAGWLIKVRPDSPDALQSEVDKLLTAEQYNQHIAH